MTLTICYNRSFVRGVLLALLFYIASSTSCPIVVHILLLTLLLDSLPITHGLTVPSRHIIEDWRATTVLRFTTVVSYCRLLNIALFLDFGVGPRRPLPEYRTANSHLPTAQSDSTLKVLAHSHTELQLPLVQHKLLRHQVPLLLEGYKILVLVLRRGGFATRNGTNGHETNETEAGAVFDDVTAESNSISTGSTTGLGLLAGSVDLNVDGERGKRGRGPCAVEETSLFGGVDTGDTEEVGNLGKSLAVAWKKFRIPYVREVSVM